MASGGAPAAQQQTSRRNVNGYLPIENYGLIGNMRTCALVGIDGSIDFMCCKYIRSFRVPNPEFRVHCTEFSQGQTSTLLPSFAGFLIKTREATSASLHLRIPHLRQSSTIYHPRISYRQATFTKMVLLPSLTSFLVQRTAMSCLGGQNRWHTGKQLLYKMS
jgi:hypothetical protein